MTEKVMKCLCIPWADNIEKLNAPIILDQIRRGVEHKIKQFEYCPWCGDKLINHMEEHGK